MRRGDDHGFAWWRSYRGCSYNEAELVRNAIFTLWRIDYCTTGTKQQQQHGSLSPINTGFPSRHPQRTQSLLSDHSHQQHPPPTVSCHSPMHKYNPHYHITIAIVVYLSLHLRSLLRLAQIARHRISRFLRLSTRRLE